MLSPAVRVLSTVGLLACYACVSAVRVLPAVRVLSAVPRAVLQKMPGCLSTMDVKKVVRVQKVKKPPRRVVSTRGHQQRRRSLQSVSQRLWKFGPTLAVMCTVWAYCCMLVVKLVRCGKIHTFSVCVHVCAK